MAIRPDQAVDPPLTMVLFLSLSLFFSFRGPVDSSADDDVRALVLSTYILFFLLASPVLVSASRSLTRYLVGLG